jgi:hypothetical protein
LGAHFAIKGGSVVTDGAWPMVGWLDNGCTGLLLSPSLVVFAAHCGSATRLWLGDAFELQIDTESGTANVLNAPLGSAHDLGECQLHPDGRLTTGTDVAWCRLGRAALPPEQVVPPLLACARASLIEGNNVRLVGFGIQDVSGTEAGVKREVDAPIITLGLEPQIGEAQRGTCPGDSGSPAFVQLKNEPVSEWQVLGILSSGAPGAVCGTGAYTELANVLPWLEASSGVDLSPCGSSDGGWAPTARCRVPAIDRGGVPSPQTELSASCGPSFQPKKADSSCSTARGITGGDVGLELGLLLGCWVLLARRRAQLHASAQANTAHSM